MSQRPWRDHKSKDFGSDANALRRLAETIQREDGYNDETMHLMFRCAEKIEKERTARLAAELAAKNFRAVLEGAEFERLDDLAKETRDCRRIGEVAKERIAEIVAARIAAEARAGELTELLLRMQRAGQKQDWNTNYETLMNDVREALRGREGK